MVFIRCAVKVAKTKCTYNIIHSVDGVWQTKAQRLCILYLPVIYTIPKEVQSSLESSMCYIPLTSIVLTVSESLEDQVDPGD